MAIQIPGPRKRRTRQHVIADLSVHHVERFILEQGHTAHRLGSDYGYDLLMSTFDDRGYVEPGSVYFQFKAKETLDGVGAHHAYDMDIRDYNLWTREKMPVIFVLYDATRRRAYWLTIQEYFRGDVARRPRGGARSVRIRIPRRQVVNGRAIAKMREIKWAALRQEQEEKG
jgi:hypothetical protein